MSILNRLRWWLIRMLAGDRCIIINATVIGTVHARRVVPVWTWDSSFHDPQEDEDDDEKPRWIRGWKPGWHRWHWWRRWLP